MANGENCERLRMNDAEAVWSVLRTINDPEMPISIVDLGIVERVTLRDEAGAAGGRSAEIDITPTFVGCPALEILRREIVTKVGALPAVQTVEVRFVYDPPWSVERISPAGREALRQFGVTTPGRSELGADTRTDQRVPVALGLPQASTPDEPTCPFCGSTKTTLESAFGPTRCKMIYYCESCRNSFEHLKHV
jgi:ring-1,2-phenylacetyl-CoA epoxidase subunit PaaD